MASSKDYLHFIAEQLSGLEEITDKSMMGETIIYYRGKIAAYLCDGRLLVKPTDRAKAWLPAAPLVSPYAGAKQMLLVEEVDNREFLTHLFAAMYDELPSPKPKKKRQKLEKRIKAAF